MKKIFLLSIFMCTICCSGNYVSKNHDVIETISIDIRKLQFETDISFLIDTNYFEIIPLETNDECLIAEISRITFSNNKIVVFDEKAQGVYIFNRDGSFHAKVRAIGQGPGEYPPGINDIMVSKKHIGVLNPPFGIMLYDFDGKFVKKIPLNDTWGMNLFTFDEINYYLVNNWSSSNKGYYHLFKIDTEKNKVESLMPFLKSDEENHRGWGLMQYYTLYDNRALLYYSSIDTIYNLSHTGEITPKYVIDIVHNKLPNTLRLGNGRVAMKSSIENGYVMGIVNVAETSRYLIFKIDGGKYHAVYDKKEKETKVVTGVFRIKSFFNISVNIDFSLSEGDYILPYITGLAANNDKEYFAKLKSEKKWTWGDGTNPFEKEFFKVIQNVQDDEDNPILFIFKLKE